MAVFTVGPNSRMYWDQYDLTPTLKDGSFEISTETLDKTAWNDTTRVSRAGLDSVSISASGHQNLGTGEIEDILKSELGTDDSIIAMGANVSAEGDIVYVSKGMMSQFTPVQGAVGDQAAYGFAAQSSGGWFRGKLMANKAARTSTGVSAGIQLGVIAATQKMHASLHIFAVSGTNPTLDVTVKSDDNGSYTSATTRLTFAQATAAGSQYLGPTLGPAGADDYWRIAWTIGGTATPTFNFAVVFGHDINGG